MVNLQSCIKASNQLIRHKRYIRSSLRLESNLQISILHPDTWIAAEYAKSTLSAQLLRPKVSCVPSTGAVFGALATPINSDQYRSDSPACSQILRASVSRYEILSPCDLLIPPKNLDCKFGNVRRSCRLYLLESTASGLSVACRDIASQTDVSISNANYIAITSEYEFSRLPFKVSTFFAANEESILGCFSTVGQLLLSSAIASHNDSPETPFVAPSLPPLLTAIRNFRLEAS